jgi:hypothetical protein
MRVGICVGDGGCASWGGDQVGFASWGGQVGVFKLGCVQVGVCRSGVVNSWFPSFERKPPHHVKVNPLGEGKCMNYRYYSIALHILYPEEILSKCDPSQDHTLCTRIIKVSIEDQYTDRIWRNEGWIIGMIFVGVLALQVEVWCW